jgi:5-formyltetrahydrofolate cyclo-ligase
MVDSTDEKSELRESLLQKRRNLDRRERENSSEVVRRILADESRLLDADHLAGYVAFDGEVDLLPLLRERLKTGVRVSLPRVENDNRMHYVPVQDFDDLEEGAFGIPEPAGDRSDLGDLELFLVPGVGFDPAGRRLGMGWGYYDRILSRRLEHEGPEPILVGVCHDVQLVERIPTESHDVTMDIVVTGERLIDMSEETSNHATSDQNVNGR